MHQVLTPLSKGCQAIKHMWRLKHHNLTQFYKMRTLLLHIIIMERERDKITLADEFGSSVVIGSSVVTGSSVVAGSSVVIGSSVVAGYSVVDVFSVGAVFSLIMG